MIEDLHRLVRTDGRLEHHGVEQVPFVWRCDGRSLALPSTRQAFLLDRFERFSHNRPADLERLGECGLGWKHAVGGKATRDDRIDEDVDHHDAETCRPAGQAPPSTAGSLRPKAAAKAVQARDRSLSRQYHNLYDVTHQLTFDRRMMYYLGRDADYTRRDLPRPYFGSTASIRLASRAAGCTAGRGGRGAADRDRLRR